MYASHHTLKRDQWLASLKSVPDDLKKRVARMKEGEYSWSISCLVDPKEKAKVTTYHELGHVLHLTTDRMADEINQFLKAEAPRQTGWHATLSEYSNSNDYEFVAESFALYMSDEKQHYRIHPKLLRIFKDHDSNAHT